MSSPATFNRHALGKIWTLADLPVEWEGFQILLGGDADHDLVIDPDEVDQIDWIAFSEAVGDFQRRAKMKLVEQDSELGKNTLKVLQNFFDPQAPTPGALREFGDLAFRAATSPVCQPPGPPLVGHTPEERAVCRMWNNYGAAIAEQAAAHGIPVESSLGVFYVESKTAYDLATGLVLLRYEPHVFKKKSGGHDVPAERGGQAAEWRNFERAFEKHTDAALRSCSYGLPQLMGFNFGVTKHHSPREMVLAFQDSCMEQVAGFFGFVKANSLLKPILKQDWRTFARIYNGNGAVDDYSGKLNRAMKVIGSLKQDGAAFKV